METTREEVREILTEWSQDDSASVIAFRLKVKDSKVTISVLRVDSDDEYIDEISTIFYESLKEQAKGIGKHTKKL